MRKAAAATHHGLYALLILQPLLGFFATNAWGFPMQGKTAYLGFIHLPKFMEASTGLANVLSWGHTDRRLPVRGAAGGACRRARSTTTPSAATAR